jgi:hypothetical protein
MKFLILVFFSFISIAMFSQEYPPDVFFKPYKYPKHYSYDGAFNIIELNVIFPKGNAGYGGNLKIDFASVKLGSHALRLNFGFGAGSTNSGTKTYFAPTLLANGFSGENYITDTYSVPNIQLYPRLWIRVLNPLNLSITAGPSFYVNTNKTTGHYTVYDYIFQKEEFVIKKYAKSSKAGISYFIEAKAMINFKNWGISGGLSKHNNGFSHTWQPVIGFWFGQKQLKPVIN